MYSLPRETHQEIIDRLAPEVKQVLRMTSKYFTELISPQAVNLLEFGAKHNLLSYCGLGLSLKNPKTMVCRIAAKRGHLEVLKWARSNNCHWDSWTCTIAARYGHLEVLKWARSNNCPWDKWVCASASDGGHLKVLQWLKSQECPWDSETCMYAAYRGHLEVLRWARSNDCPWDEWTCINAAKHDRLEVLQWAIEHGCPWNFRGAHILQYPQRVQEYVKSLRG
jgi:hypothetical protein